MPRGINVQTCLHVNRLIDKVRRKMQTSSQRFDPTVIEPMVALIRSEYDIHYIHQTGCLVNIFVLFLYMYLIHFVQHSLEDITTIK